MENIYIFIDSIFLGNWIAGFRGFKLMEINVATAVFQVHFYVYSWKRKDQKTVQVEGWRMFFFRFRRGFLFVKNWNPFKDCKKKDTETFQAVLYGSYGPPTKPSRASQSHTVCWPDFHVEWDVQLLLEENH